MPRDGSNVYSLPAGSTVANGQTATASDLNTPLADLETDMNIARPIVAGGTGATSAAGARAALEVDGSMRLIEAIDITSSTASHGVDIPSWATEVRLEVETFIPATSNVTLACRIGTGGSGGSFVSTSTYYRQYMQLVGSTLTGAEGTIGSWDLCPSTGNTGGIVQGHGFATLRGFNDSVQIAKGESHFQGVDSGGTNRAWSSWFYLTAAAGGNANALQLFASTGNISTLKANVYGLRAT